MDVETEKLDTEKLDIVKSALRAKMKKRRADLKVINKTPEDRMQEVFAVQLLECLGTLKLRSGIMRPLVVGGYAAIQSECSVWGLMATLRKAGFCLSLPYIRKAGVPLEFLEWIPGYPLIAGVFGARTPDPAYAARIVPDVLLVPLLAFDARGYRLGYGGGFYDRSIAYYQPVLTAGIAYAGQEVPEVPVGCHDMALSCILTENGLMHPQKETGTSGL